MAEPRRSRGKNARWSDEQVDGFIGNLLRAGVIVAAVVGAMGGVLYLAAHGMEPAAPRHFRGEPDELRSIRGILGGALSLRSTAVIQLALLLLIATPVARVACSLAAFVLQRDRAFVVITSVVLGLLLFGLTGGISG